MILAKCFGERRCGNHLVQEVLSENWGDEVTPYQGESQHLPYLPGFAAEQRDAWDRVVIAVKAPSPWLRSALAWQDDGPGEKKRWRSELDRWVTKYGNYLHHFGQPGEQDAVVWARYEDYVRAPRETILSWGENLAGLSEPSDSLWLPREHCSPATDDQRGGFDLAYYRDEAWRDDLPEGALRAVRQWFSHDTCQGVYNAIYPDRPLA